MRKSKEIDSRETQTKTESDYNDRFNSSHRSDTSERANEKKTERRKTKADNFIRIMTVGVECTYEGREHLLYYDNSNDSFILNPSMKKQKNSASVKFNRKSITGFVVHKGKLTLNLKTHKIQLKTKKPYTKILSTSIMSFVHGTFKWHHIEINNIEEVQLDEKEDDDDDDDEEVTLQSTNSRPILIDETILVDEKVADESNTSSDKERSQDELMDEEPDHKEEPPKPQNTEEYMLILENELSKLDDEPQEEDLQKFEPSDFELLTPEQPPSDAYENPQESIKTNECEESVKIKESEESIKSTESSSDSQELVKPSSSDDVPNPPKEITPLIYGKKESKGLSVCTCVIS